MRRFFLPFIFGAASALIAIPPSWAQDRAKEEQRDAMPVKSIGDITRTCRAYPGLFTLYQDTISGRTYALITSEHLHKEFIHFSYVADGVLDAGFFRGAYRGARIFMLDKYFGRINVVLQNTSYYFDSTNALSRAAGANINRPTLASLRIAGADASKNEWLVEADELFLTENLQQVKPSPDPNAKPGSRFDVGTLNKEKSRMLRIGNYPKNTDVTVEYVFENPYPVAEGHDAVTDPRVVNVVIQHSLIEVPQSSYKPRRDDPRIGYFTQQVTDMTSSDPAPWRDVINRWHLVKKDPAAAISEPVEPIVWWIENTTPRELRNAIREGVLSWNIAFEKAGFKNAVVVKEQPDDADWDAGDIRYNVLRWTSSPMPPFGGYGPSFVNPRTGQILGADIMLEYTYLTRRLHWEKAFETAGLFSAMQSSQKKHDDHYCEIGSCMQQAMLYGLHTLHANGVSKVEEDEFLRQALYRLVLHEVGHTFGLTHNFRASGLHTPAELADQSLTRRTGLTGSVMEYPANNMPADSSHRGHYFDYEPGPYDLWTIEYGYSAALPDAAAEENRLNALLARSTAPELAYGNDADDMRSPGKGIDPRSMIFDLSSDPVALSEQRIQQVQTILPKLKARYAVDGDSYQELRNAYLVVTSEQATALTVASRYIGGVYVDRALAGQPGAKQPFRPVPYDEQKRAMAVLARYGFAPDAFRAPEDLYTHLQMQRRGFSHFEGTEDPKLHERVLNIQTDLLNQLLHPVVLQRISDTELYGNRYTLAEVMTDLTNAVFVKSGDNTLSRNLQVEYVGRLAAMIAPGAKYHNAAQSMALYEINRIATQMKAIRAGDTASKAHRDYVLHIIEKALEAK